MNTNSFRIYCKHGNFDGFLYNEDIIRFYKDGITFYYHTPEGECPVVYIPYADMRYITKFYG